MIRILAFLLLPTLAVAEVDQGPPNADFAPAFANQTRAPALPATTVRTQVFAAGLERPWGIDALPSGQFLVTEIGGTMRIINADGSITRPLPGLPEIAVVGQGGLLDVNVSPDFGNDRTVFWTYAKDVRRGTVTAAASGVLQNDGTLTDVRDIFVQTPAVRGGRHFGSRVVPLPDGTVAITTGDRGEGDGGELVQDNATTIGKVIRVNRDGTAPSDNPFVGRAGDDLIWSSGHRNAQGAALDSTGTLWTVEHGPRGGDELNRPEASVNYGWPVVSYGINYTGSDVGRGLPRADGYAEPVYYWDPVIAPSGMTFYDGSFGPWQGDLLIASLNPGGLVRLKLENGRVVGEERLLGELGRLRDVEVLPDGAILVIGDAGNAIRVDLQ